MNDTTLIRFAVSLAASCLISAVIALAGCANEPAAPPDTLTCVKLQPGVVTAYRQTLDETPVKAGTWAIITGRDCTYAYTSASVNGVPLVLPPNPPIELETMSGVRVALPGTDIFYETVIHRETNVNQ